MSVFSNNIINDISQTEKIRYWFKKRIFKRFEEYGFKNKNNQYIFDYRNIFENPNRYRNRILSYIYHDLVNLWAVTYRDELWAMGVNSTRTIVNKKKGQNDFCVIVKFSPNIDHIEDTDDEVEINNLKIEV